jgi:hypothetical protein
MRDGISEKVLSIFYRRGELNDNCKEGSKLWDDENRWDEDMLRMQGGEIKEQ